MDDKEHSFTISTPAVVKAQWENRGLPVRSHWAVIGFSLRVNFDDVLSILTEVYKLTVFSSSHALHQSFRAQTAVLLLTTSSPWLEFIWIANLLGLFLLITCSTVDVWIPDLYDRQRMLCCILCSFLERKKHGLSNAPIVRACKILRSSHYFSVQNVDEINFFALT